MTIDIPGQPDGIDDDSRDLPDPHRAAERIREYVSEFGDGLYDVAGGRPLYGRDLEAVVRALSAVEQDRDALSAVEQDRDALSDALADAERQRGAVEEENDRLHKLVDDLRQQDAAERAVLDAAQAWREAMAASSAVGIQVHDMTVWRASEDLYAAVDEWSKP